VNFYECEFSTYAWSNAYRITGEVNALTETYFAIRQHTYARNTKTKNNTNAINKSVVKIPPLKMVAPPVITLLFLWLMQIFRLLYSSEAVTAAAAADRPTITCRLFFQLVHFSWVETSSPKGTMTKVIWQKAESLWQVHPTPRLHSPGGSIGLTVWLKCMFWLVFNPQISPSPVGQDPHLTQCVIGPHKSTCQMASKSVERFKHGVRMWETTDRQTTIRRIGIGGSDPA